FTRTGTTWTEQQKLLPPDGVTDAQFGISVDLDGDTAIIGANRDDDNGIRSGSAYIYTRSDTTWTLQAKLIASDGGEEERFGIDVALEGDTAMIGAETSDNGDFSGSVYVFTRNGSTWTEGQKLLASDGAALDWFGFYIDLDGDTALFSASQDDDNGSNSGSAYIFTRTGTTWTEQQKLKASDGAAGDRFSEYDVALDGDTALIGSYYNDDNGANSGSAYIFTRTGTTWTEQQKLNAADGAAQDWFGISVDLSGNTAFIGAPGKNDLMGSAYVFTKSSADLIFSITGGLGVKAEITNNGTSDASDIPWQIHVEGGILGMINKTVNGTVDIPAGDTVTVKTGILLGFGAISIIAKVADEEQTATGTQLIIFSIVK
ncbi:MAG: FG-GAP repeat protein, partial [Candidatus Thermoplasmatota archaeon]